MTLSICHCGFKITTKNCKDSVKRADYTEYNLGITKLLQYDCKNCGTTKSIARKRVKNG